MQNTRKTVAQMMLKSATTTDSTLMPNAEFSPWLEQKRAEVDVQVTHVPFAHMANWGFNADGNLAHSSGQFFSIAGLRVDTTWQGGASWTQPIIVQPEVGFLGFIVQMHNGVLHFLCQAKIEPGNLPYVQISPTIQATRSNYTQVHGGARPLFLEYFNGEKPHTVLLDQLQSEQGGRFYRKRNRNIIVQIDEELTLPPQFCWLTLGQIKQLLGHSNVMNMDARTVISAIQFAGADAQPATSDLGEQMQHSALGLGQSLHTFAACQSWLTSFRALHDINAQLIPLTEVDNWHRDEKAIWHEDNKYFRVIGVQSQISNREVARWHQPLVESAQHGLCALACKTINGTLHVLVQAKMEGGLTDLVELAPTVQCLPDNYDTSTLPFLDLVQNVDASQVIFDTHQSEEGGRFYREQNRNMLFWANEISDTDLPPEYRWVTIKQVLRFAQFSHRCNIQLRSLLAALKYT